MTHSTRHFCEVVEANQRLVDCAAIAGCGALVAAAVRPFQDLPFVDDWTYAWSVAGLLERGDLRLLEWSTSANFAQVLWGALFCLPFGFSFAALRVSTAVAAIGGLCAFYLLLRELEVGRRVALVGTATLALNPIFFVLSWTFMTDVPFVTVMVACALATVRAMRMKSRLWFGAAIALASIALAVRSVGLAVPGALAAAVAFDSRMSGPRRARWLASAILVPGLVGALLVWWTAGHIESPVDLTGVRDAPATRLSNLRYAIPLLPASLASTVAALTGVVGLAVLPLSAGAFAGSRRVGSFCVVMIALAAIAGWAGLAPAPLEYGSLWSLRELGLSAAMLPGSAPAPCPRWWPPLAMAISAAPLGVLLSYVTAKRRVSAGETFLWWLALAHVALIALLWLAYDRYLLVLVPIAIALLLASTARIALSVSVAALLPFAFVSIVGLHDELACNRAVWRGVDALRRVGARDSEIDGGYVVNGWLQYAHPEHAPRDANGNLVVPHLTNEMEPRYLIASRPIDGWKTLEVVSVDRWLGPLEALYLLENPNPQLAAR